MTNPLKQISWNKISTLISTTCFVCFSLSLLPPTNQKSPFVLAFFNNISFLRNLFGNRKKRKQNKKLTNQQTKQTRRKNKNWKYYHLSRHKQGLYFRLKCLLPLERAIKKFPYPHSIHHHHRDSQDIVKTTNKEHHKKWVESERSNAEK